MDMLTSILTCLGLSNTKDREIGEAHLRLDLNEKEYINRSLPSFPNNSVPEPYRDDNNNKNAGGKNLIIEHTHTNTDPSNLVDEFMHILLTFSSFSSTSNDTISIRNALTHKIYNPSTNPIHTRSFTTTLATTILTRLETTIANPASTLTLPAPIRTILDKARSLADEIFGFIDEHPVLVTLLALAVLVEVAPWVLAWLGFGELGPVAGSWAALWQARYAGYVPRGSLFAFLQRCGMIWGH